MDMREFLEEVKASADYAGQVVYVREVAARGAVYGDTDEALAEPVQQALAERGIQRLYSHQAEAINSFRAGQDVLVVTGTASGKSLCYVVPIVETLLADEEATALLLFPTKALSQDQFKGFSTALGAAGLTQVLAGVYDGDTPADMRRRLRDGGSVIFSNPDMLHAGMMAQHGRWARFLANLRVLVIDEVHVYSGMFGSNMANLMRRFFRVCSHYGSGPQIVGCSATIANPQELGEKLSGRKMRLIDEDGSPRGKRTYVFWNPPRIRGGDWRSRRSANVEAHELMAMLVQRGVPTITFSKAKMTAEMIYRYVCEKLGAEAPQLVGKVAPYRGGYRPQERREIERQLLNGELLGVSATRALELGIDVGGLDASILVGYPGTLASFFQQSGRAGRQDRDSLAVLVGIDTAINQYVMSNPEYIFGRPIEEGVIDEDNPFVITGHLRCATHELPVGEREAGLFGRHARLVLRLLEENAKVKEIEGVWYHAANETPQHEVSLRDYADANVMIEDVGSGEVLGEVNRFDAPPILHPGAVYMHLGDTYLVRELDLERNIASVERADVNYYTQPLGGTDVHHVDHRLREKAFGTGTAYWGEVTAYFDTVMYERVHFYSLDAISQHGVDLPKMQLETMAVWLVPAEELMEEVRGAGLDTHSGLRGIGYATRMLLPGFMTCDTLDFSHSIGSANSPWNAIFIYERYPLGLGFTEKVYERLDEIMPAVMGHVRACPCADGCPCCVGKPLRGYATWNIARGEAHIPSKRAALMILEGLLGEMSGLDNADAGALSGSDAEAELRLEMALRRRLERMREPSVFHPIEPKPQTEYPEVEAGGEMRDADAAMRARRGRSFDKELRKRLAKKLPSDGLEPLTGKGRSPEGMSKRSNKPPTYFPGRPDVAEEEVESDRDAGSEDMGKDVGAQGPVAQGDSLASRARRLKKKRDAERE